MSGYPPRDLLFREGFVDRCERTVRMLAAKLPPEMLVLVGTPRRSSNGDRCMNSVAACRGGEIIAWGDKRLLPGYDVFDDDRYFMPGEQSAIVDHKGVRIGLLICEDLWQGGDVRERTSYEVDPVVELVEQGAQLLIAASAQPLHDWQARAPSETISLAWPECTGFPSRRSIVPVPRTTSSSTAL